jgi:ubiquinone/menaquinone biosynthesis C-methylase UbiE
MSHDAHERRFHGQPDRLRAPERIARLDLDQVVALSIEDLASPRMLDVGTGTGIFAEAFAARGLDVVGIDASDEMVELARRLVPAARFEQAPAEAITYGDGAFDVAFLGLVLHETDDPVQALCEAQRVSTRRVVILEWPYEEDGHGPPLEHRLTVDRVRDLARQAGLEQIEHIRLAHVDLYRLAAEYQEA